MEWGEGQDPQAQRYPIRLVTFTVWPIGFGKSRLWGEEAASTGAFFWSKFSLPNHRDSATAPPPRAAVRHRYTFGAGRTSGPLSLLGFSENNLENAPQAQGESGSLEANKMRRLGRQSSPESTEALHHLAYRIEATPPGKREWEG